MYEAQEPKAKTYKENLALKVMFYLEYQFAQRENSRMIQIPQYTQAGDLEKEKIREEKKQNSYAFF